MISTAAAGPGRARGLSCDADGPSEPRPAGGGHGGPVRDGPGHVTRASDRALTRDSAPSVLAGAGHARTGPPADPAWQARTPSQTQTPSRPGRRPSPSRTRTPHSESVESVRPHSGWPTGACQSPGRRVTPAVIITESSHRRLSRPGAPGTVTSESDPALRLPVRAAAYY